MKVARAAQTETYDGKLLSIKQEKVQTIAIMTVLPELTELQKRAFELAVQEGYYDYPRKCDLVHLAKTTKVAYSTYQFHLRNAEKKLMPYLYQSHVS